MMQLIKYCWERLNWSFTPLNGKIPVLKEWQRRPRETLEDIQQWVNQGNIGLRTGTTSGVVVVDLDPGADTSSWPAPLPETVSVQTGRDGGRHFYFAYHQPLSGGNGKLGPHVDLKADGGQVVFPGSVHPDTGRRYEFITSPESVALAPLPAWILSFVKPQRSTYQAEEKRLSKYVESAILLECGNVERSHEGERNNALNRAAFSLGQLVGARYVSREYVAGHLLESAEAVGLATAEAERTIDSGLAAGMQQPRIIQRRTPKQGPVDIPIPLPPDNSTVKDNEVLIPAMHINDDDQFIEQNNDTFSQEVMERIPENILYRKANMVGELVGEPGVTRFYELRENSARILIDKHIRLITWNYSSRTRRQEKLFKPCSKDWAGIITAAAVKWPTVRELKLQVGYPIFGPDWQRIEPGWHDGIYYDEPPELANLKPEQDIQIITETLENLIVDFPFKEDADRENYFGLLLTPLIAPAINGNRPLHLITSPLERTGKTKLAEDVLGIVLTGKPAPALQITSKEEEVEKRIVALIISGDTLIHFDNLPPKIDSPALASLLTGTIIQGRILSRSVMVSLPNYLTVVGSGNNLTCSGEIAKRSIPINLLPDTSAPEERRNFAHPDLRGFIKHERRAILECLLGMVENWRAATPDERRFPVEVKGVGRLGGFEAWSEVIGGILRVNGFRKWRTNETEWRKNIDYQRQDIEALVTQWAKDWKVGIEVSLSEIIQSARAAEVYPHIYCEKDEARQVSRAGKLLSRYIETPVLEYRIIKTRRTGTGIKYVLTTLHAARDMHV